MNIIVVGCGRVGSQLSTMLSEQGNNVTVIDKEAKSFERLGGTFNGVTIKGLGFDEETLQIAGIEECDFFVAVTNLDNTNLMAAEVADRIFGVENVVARLYNPERTNTYERLGLDYVCGTTLLAETLYDKIAAGHDHHVTSYGEVEIILFPINDLLVGKPVSALADEGKILPAIIKRNNHTFIPTRESVFRKGDIVRVAVFSDQVRRLKKYMEE